MQRLSFILSFLVIVSSQVIAQSSGRVEPVKTIADSVYIYTDGHGDEYKLLYKNGTCLFVYTPLPIERLSTDKLKVFTVKCDKFLYDHTTWHLRKLVHDDEWLLPAKQNGVSIVQLDRDHNPYFLKKDAWVKKQTDSVFQWMAKEMIPFDINNRRDRCYAGRIIKQKFISKAGVVTDHDEFFFKPDPVYSFIRQDTAAIYIYISKGKYSATVLEKSAGKQVLITASVHQGSIPVTVDNGGREGRAATYLSLLTIQPMQDE